MRSLTGLLLTVTGFLACPCHLLLTLPLLLTLLGRTSLGLFLQQNTGLVFVGASIYFLSRLDPGYVSSIGSARAGGTRSVARSVNCQGATEIRGKLGPIAPPRGW
jgi:mercuric ion transport protein